VLGGWPGIARAGGPAAVAFVDQRGYWAQALTGSTGGATVSVPDTGWTTSGVLLGLLSAGLAVLMAFAALYAGRLPEWARRAAGIGRPAMAELHRLHTGHIGDYAAWLVFGAAAIAGLLTL
jgi:multicomponent Na+:H+ antiporter subunit D